MMSAAGGEGRKVGKDGGRERGRVYVVLTTLLPAAAAVAAAASPALSV